MILPSQEIKHLSIMGPPSPNFLIYPFTDENLRGSSYDLTVGEEYYIGEDCDSSKLSTEGLRQRQSFTIPPHAVCFILTTESIALPKDVTAKVSLRMTYIYAGMVLTSQPPFDPGYHGRVVVMLHNLSSEPFHLKRGDRLATIEFARLSEATTVSKPHRSVNNLEEQLPNPLVSSLSDIARRSTATNERVVWLSGQMLIFAALIVAVLAVPGFLSFNSLLEGQNEQKALFKKMEESLATYKRELEKSQSVVEKLRVEVEVLRKGKKDSVNATEARLRNVEGKGE